MSRSSIKGYTVVRKQYGSEYTVFAITSEGSRRVNGHYVDNPSYGSHITAERTHGRFLDLADAQKAVASIDEIFARWKPSVQKAYNEYIALDRKMYAEIDAFVMVIKKDLA